MKKLFFSLVCTALMLPAFAQQAAVSKPDSAAKGIIIDKIIAKVDNYYVLKSELDMAMEQTKGQANAPTEGQVLESLILQKFLVAKADIDSVTIPEKQLENELTGRMDQMALRYGSEKSIIEQFGKSLDQLKGEYRSQVREQLLAQEMQKKITEDVKITPSEVRKFFNSIPKDSIPYLPAEVQIGQIVRIAKVTKEERAQLRQRLLAIKKRAESGEDFAALAKQYSEDVGSAQNGGSLGFAKRGAMVAEFEAAAMKLKPGQLSEIIESEYGLHLIQLVEIRGQEYNSRHILLRPEYSRLDVSEPRRFLDSLRTRILSDSLKFDKAARDFSEDKNTSTNGGMMTDAQTGSSKLSLDESMEPTLYFMLDTMKVGSISRPVEFRTEDGKSAMRILYFKTKFPPHQANLKDDYQKLQTYALTRERNRAVDKWFNKSKSEVFFQIDPEYRSFPSLQKLLQNNPSGQ